MLIESSTSKKSPRNVSSYYRNSIYRLQFSIKPKKAILTSHTTSTSVLADISHLARMLP